MTATVTALVVSYHTGPRLVECLYALKSDPDVAAIVITDNGNPPGTEAWLDAFVAATPKAQILRLPNPGFGAGVNAAARLAASDHLLVINPDCVIKRGALRPLIAALDGAPSPAIAGGRIFDLQGREERGARRETLTLSRALGLSRWTLEHEPRPPEPVRVGAISGAFFLIRTKDFQSLGGFDEGYFIHVEDVDLCRRALEAGGAVLYVPGAGALHYGSTSDVPSAFVTGHKAKSLARYFRKFARGPFERLIVEAAVPFIGLALKLWA
ncbi:MAG: glycosyltransferase family 2 protein [Hyphomonas sp.]|uniref:glycosyltransferase family 2 protein n=1 Tax=Hyphomonas sp. TaxID=87 RepID=UPI0025BCD76F|nr:glycosyltransferase family 2 protein [Hyphomonas sp.]MBA4338714.1 glycosyltransferase family 2 protein [Hyphomonas sp.]